MTSCQTDLAPSGRPAFDQRVVLFLGLEMQAENENAARAKAAVDSTQQLRCLGARKGVELAEKEDGEVVIRSEVCSRDISEYVRAREASGVGRRTGVLDRSGRDVDPTARTSSGGEALGSGTSSSGKTRSERHGVRVNELALGAVLRQVGHCRANQLGGLCFVHLCDLPTQFAIN